MDGSEYAVATLVESPRGIPLVKDPNKPPPQYWKLPGGRSKEGESAMEAAARELKEETGISLAPESLNLIHKENRGHHIFTLFRIQLPSLPELQNTGDEDEEIRIFTLQQIAELQDLFPPHRNVLLQYQLL